MTIHSIKGKGSAILSYMSQLDSLRALAILGVLITHFLQSDDPLRTEFPWGWLGVRLFFVLSGFLIVGILVQCRQTVDQGLISPWKMLQNFYIRRCLRLFPIYYLYLAIVFLIHPEVRNHIVAFIFYVQNLTFAVQPETFHTMAHLWSLAVEAQFYLILPWFIIFLPKRWLIPMLLIISLAAPVIRIGLLLNGFTVHQMNMLMPCHFDTLGLGGLLSALIASGKRGRLLAKKLLSIGLQVGTPLLLAYIVGRLLNVDDRILGVFAESGAGLFFIWLIGHASAGFNGFPGSILNHSLLIYGGKISYGLYIFHLEVPNLFQHIFQHIVLPELHLNAINHARLVFPIYAAVTIVVAAVSWELIEKPMNQLKRHFLLK